VAVRGGGLGSAQGRTVNLLVVEVSHGEAPITEIEEGQSSGAESKSADCGGGVWAFFRGRQRRRNLGFGSPEAGESVCDCGESRQRSEVSSTVVAVSHGSLLSLACLPHSSLSIPSRYPINLEEADRDWGRPIGMGGGRSGLEEADRDGRRPIGNDEEMAWLHGLAARFGCSAWLRGLASNFVFFWYR
jgi:hypothetical protein